LIHSLKVDGKDFTVEIIDSVADYVTLMKQIFDFENLKEFLKKFPILINCMNAGELLVDVHCYWAWIKDLCVSS
jgi:phosphoglucomutase